MKCRPGDLAVIVRSHDERNIGKLVSVLRLCERREQSWWIICHSAVTHARYSDWPAGSEVATYDAYLQPIRDPGEDAQDELLRPLPEEVVA